MFRWLDFLIHPKVALARPSARAKKRAEESAARRDEAYDRLEARFKEIDKMLRKTNGVR